MNDFDRIHDYAFQLQSVAEQCTLSGGPAVFLARTLYELIDPEGTYNDAQLCMQQGYLLRKPQPVYSQSGIYPNPVTSSATLMYQIGEDAGLEITDGFGRVIKQFDLSHQQREFTFDCSLIENGVYHYRIVSPNDAEVGSGRFIIVK